MLSKVANILLLQSWIKLNACSQLISSPSTHIHLWLLAELPLWEMVRIISYFTTPTPFHSLPSPFPLSLIHIHLTLPKIAAHSMSPWFGQGGTACIEDAAELGNTLYSIFSESQKVKEALQAYRSRREKRTQEIAKFSADFGRLYSAQLPYGLGGIVRGLLFGYVPSNIWLWWLKWLYGYQPILRGLDVSGSEVDK